MTLACVEVSSAVCLPGFISFSLRRRLFGPFDSRVVHEQPGSLIAIEARDVGADGLFIGSSRWVLLQKWLSMCLKQAGRDPNGMFF